MPVESLRPSPFISRRYLYSTQLKYEVHNNPWRPLWNDEKKLVPNSIIETFEKIIWQSNSRHKQVGHRDKAMSQH